MLAPRKNHIYVNRVYCNLCDWLQNIFSGYPSFRYRSPKVRGDGYIIYFDLSTNGENNPPSTHTNIHAVFSKAHIASGLPIICRSRTCHYPANLS